MRRYYIDNLRWGAIIVLIIYHAAMAWNTWSEPNYIFFESNQIISSIVVIFSPFLMPLLFVLAGISTKYALKKRTPKQYLLERVKKLLIPFLFGTLTIMPAMTYLADCYNYKYTGSFLQHYKVLFTKFTGLTGADGGFSMGHFWFLIFLFIISVLFIIILKVQKRIKLKHKISNISITFIYLLGIPLILFHELLSIGGKSIIEYLYLFMIGYYILSNDDMIKKLSTHRWLILSVGIVATFTNTYLFLWADQTIPAIPIINTITRSLSEWFMLLAAMGIANSCFYKASNITTYMSQRSFMFYILHYIWIVLFQYLMSGLFINNTFLLFIVPVVVSYIVTFLSCEVCIRSHVLCFLMGTKTIRKTSDSP